MFHDVPLLLDKSGEERFKSRNHSNVIYNAGIETRGSRGHANFHDKCSRHLKNPHRRSRAPADKSVITRG